MQTYRNFINGEWVDSRTTERMENRNPANIDEVLGLTPMSTVEDARAAVAAAERSYPAWKRTPALRPKRASRRSRLPPKPSPP